MSSQEEHNERLVPTRVPHLDGLGLLYDKNEINEQTVRYRKLVERLKATFPDPLILNSGRDRSSGRDFPLRFYSSPGRTELCGNHTDHNHGRVLAAAIQMDMVAAAIPRKDSLVQIVSEGFGEFSLDIADKAVHPEEKGKSEALIRGIAEGIRQVVNTQIEQGQGNKNAVPRLHGFSACIESNVLPGSGLSSSASFEVLVGCILADCNGLDPSPSQLAQIGQYAENNYFGKPCGLMDQMACALGQVAALDFERPDQPAMRLFNFNPEDYGYSLLIVNTGGSHADLTDSYRDIPYEMMSVASLFGKQVLRGLRVEDLAGKINEIREQCGDRAFLRAYHFITENERAQAITEAILQGDIDRYLDIVHGSAESSWKYLQNLFPNQSPRDQGLSVALAMTEEFFAKNTGGKGVCRVHGGGFAGTIQVYVPTGFLASYMQYMQRLFGKDSVFPLRVRPYGVVCIDCID